MIVFKLLCWILYLARVDLTQEKCVYMSGVGEFKWGGEGGGGWWGGGGGRAGDRKKKKEGQGESAIKKKEAEF